MKTCIECGKPADAPKDAQGENYPICTKCLSEGWITDPVEIATEITMDSELREILNNKN